IHELVTHRHCTLAIPGVRLSVTISELETDGSRPANGSQQVASGLEHAIIHQKLAHWHKGTILRLDVVDDEPFLPSEGPGLRRCSTGKPSEKSKDVQSTAHQPSASSVVVCCDTLKLDLHGNSPTAESQRLAHRVGRRITVRRDATCGRMRKRGRAPEARVGSSRPT